MQLAIVQLPPPEHGSSLLLSPFKVTGALVLYYMSMHGTQDLVVIISVIPQIGVFWNICNKLRHKNDFDREIFFLKTINWSVPNNPTNIFTQFCEIWHYLFPGLNCCVGCVHCYASYTTKITIFSVGWRDARFFSMARWCAWWVGVGWQHDASWLK